MTPLLNSIPPPQTRTPTSPPTLQMIPRPHPRNEVPCDTNPPTHKPSNGKMLQIKGHEPQLGFHQPQQQPYPTPRTQHTPLHKPY